VYSLQVLFESNKEAAEPVVRDLPPFYLPQAISYLLPRLVPLGEPKGYMFMSYTADNREVTSRYVDVLDQRKVEFNNKIVRAVPVEDRIGLEGAVTTHYLSPTGEWFGSENKETGYTVIPSNEATLLNLWKDANLIVPDAVGPEKPATPQAVGEEAPAARKPSPAKESETPAKPAPGRLGTRPRAK
jgi:hypothetical protein